MSSIAVLCGGKSHEREISLASGRAVFDALVDGGYEAVLCDGVDELHSRIEAGTVGTVFNVLHGKQGEDGVVQGMLRALGVSCTGSGVLGSALAFDKERSKLVWQGLGLPTPSFVTLDDYEPEQAAERIGYPLIVKPIADGSSLGVSKVDTAADLHRAVTQALDCAERVMLEDYVSGAELTVGILGEEPLPVLRIESASEVYDYAAKYVDRTTRYHCPSGLETNQDRSIQQLAVRAFAALGCSHWGRVDLRLDAAGDPYLLEVNTAPGMTKTSLVPKAAAVLGLDFRALVARIVETVPEVSHGLA